MWTDKRIIYDLTPFSLLDYPDVASCILWFAGCNMRCSYCYNPDIVFGKGKMSIAEALTFIRSRQGLLDAVVLSGGECTMYKEIIPLANAIQEMGISVKVDTNGSHPQRMQELISLRLINYVSLDFKAMPDKLESITKSIFHREFEQTFNLLQASNIPFEVRTTIHSALFSRQELIAMADYLASLGYSGKYYLQNFMNDTETIDLITKRHQRLEMLPYSKDRMEIVIRN